MKFSDLVLLRIPIGGDGQNSKNWVINGNHTHCTDTLDTPKKW